MAGTETQTRQIAFNTTLFHLNHFIDPLGKLLLDNGSYVGVSLCVSKDLEGRVTARDWKLNPQPSGLLMAAPPLSHTDALFVAFNFLESHKMYNYHLTIIIVVVL